MLNTYASRINWHGLLSSTKNIHQLCRFVTFWKHQTCYFLCTKLKKERLVSWDQGTAKKKKILVSEFWKWKINCCERGKWQPTLLNCKKKFTAKFIAFTLNCQWIDECHLLMINRHFSLHILIFQFRPRDVLKGIYLCLFMNSAYALAST